MSNRHAAIILAAGSATRMGHAKQLLRYRGKTLVEHAASEALAAGFDPVLVVAGAEAEAVRQALELLPVVIVENEGWASGMGSSVAAGVRALPPCEAAAVLLADQPLVTAWHLRDMRALTSSDNCVIAARYNGTLGVPAIFGAALFQRLADLEPEKGARHILRDPSLNVTPFDLPEAATDIDTPGDFAALLAARES